MVYKMARTSSIRALAVNSPWVDADAYLIPTLHH